MESEKTLHLGAAAHAIGIAPARLRRWIREDGCPAVAGGRGRGKGYRVELEAVRAWRAGKEAPAGEEIVREVARLALDFFRRGCEPGASGQRVLGIPQAKAAAFLALFIDYVAERLVKGDMRSDEGEILMHTTEGELLTTIARQGLENVRAVDDSV